MNNVTHKKQQKIWDQEHAKPTVLLQMDSSDPSSGVTKFWEWLQKNTSTTDSEQLSILPSPEEREVEVKVLEANIVEAIKKNRIYFMSSSSRVKTEQSIQQKIARRGEATEHTPLPDIYGVRVIIGGPYMATVNAIYHRYPYPYEYPWGMRAVAYREQYAETGELLYHALHMVIPFGDRGVQQLAEVQIMDQMDFLYAEQSREAYERKQGKIS